MQKLLMVRHGKCIGNDVILNGIKNPKLAEEGKRQARECAKRLESANIEIVYSSPLRRAFETARIIVNELDLKTEIIAEERLIERDFGVLTGKPAAVIPLYAKDIIKGDRVDYFLDTLGAESYDDVCERVRPMLKELLSKHGDKNILMVTHGAVGQIIRAVYYGWPWKEALAKMPYFDNSEVIELNGKIPKL